MRKKNVLKKQDKNSRRIWIKEIIMFDEQIKTGFVTIIGRPNAGKSTLLNNILKQKIAIMSDKPQTTRNIINGVLYRF